MQSTGDFVSPLEQLTEAETEYCLRYKIYPCPDKSHFLLTDNYSKKTTATCSYFHSDADRRRPPYVRAKTDLAYNRALCAGGETCKGGECLFAHNVYEQVYHPLSIMEFFRGNGALELGAKFIKTRGEDQTNGFLGACGAQRGDWVVKEKPRITLSGFSRKRNFGSSFEGMPACFGEERDILKKGFEDNENEGRRRGERPRSSEEPEKRWMEAESGYKEFLTTFKTKKCENLQTHEILLEKK
jgi:hypothetical protein